MTAMFDVQSSPGLNKLQKETSFDEVTEAVLKDSTGGW